MAESGDTEEPTADNEEEVNLPPIDLAVDFYARPDPVLQDLVNIATLGPGLAVTLYLPWGIVSGHIEPMTQFFSAAARGLREGATRAQAQGDDNAVGLADAIAGRSFDPLARPMSQDEWRDMNFHQGFDLSTFIHLTHVEVFVPMWKESQKVEHMRIRLNSVTAWTYGMIREATE